MSILKDILEGALYHLRFEGNNLSGAIKREEESIKYSQEFMDKNTLRLTQILNEVDEIRAAAKLLGITLEIREEP